MVFENFACVFVLASKHSEKVSMIGEKKCVFVSRWKNQSRLNIFAMMNAVIALASVRTHTYAPEA